MGSKRSDGGWRNSEDPGRLLARVVKEIQEDKRCALALWKLSDRADDLVAKVGGGEGVLGLSAQAPGLTAPRA